jgi:hypothetical protein
MTGDELELSSATPDDASCVLAPDLAQCYRCRQAQLPTATIGLGSPTADITAAHRRHAELAELVWARENEK